jgi:hypothetical protein
MEKMQRGSFKWMSQFDLQDVFSISFGMQQGKR